MKSHFYRGFLAVLASTLLCATAAARTLEFNTKQVTDADVAVSPDGKQLVFTILGHLFRLPVKGAPPSNSASGLAMIVTRPIRQTVSASRSFPIATEAAATCSCWSWRAKKLPRQRTNLRQASPPGRPTARLSSICAFCLGRKTRGLRPSLADRPRVNFASSRSAAMPSRKPSEKRGFSGRSSFYPASSPPGPWSSNRMLAAGSFHARQPTLRRSLRRRKRLPACSPCKATSDASPEAPKGMASTYATLKYAFSPCPMVLRRSFPPFPAAPRRRGSPSARTANPPTCPKGDDLSRSRGTAARARA
jgi:hypothetical protein